MKFSDIPQFTRGAVYAVDVPWNQIEGWIQSFNDLKNGIELDPDFQREHVWTLTQQERYIEFLLRGGKSSKDIYWNCFGWQKSYNGPMVLVDGKQRLQSIRLFLENKIKVFGLFFNEFEGCPSLMDATLRFHVNDLKTKAEVIQWYLDLNFGGTPHTDSERQRVECLLKMYN